ncbi:MAG: HAMP domain-containing protein, partial [Candidatus Omnitrophica bacterium]|nr:HAMP domain-containing protein [Candidatus Omnitrophota bacterium]
MKIGRKITVSFLMAGLMIAGIAVPVTYITARDIIKRSIFAYLSTTAASRAAHVDTFLETSKEAILQLSKSIVVERFLSTGKKGEDYDRNQGTGTYRLNNTNTHLKRIYDIFVLNKHGIVVASSHGPDVGKDKRNDPYFLGGKKGIFIKDAYISADKKVPTIGFAAPILDKEKNSVLGVVVARASMDRIDRIVGNRTCWTETGEIYILNKHGYMITPSRFVKDTFLTVRGAARPTQEKLNVTEEHWDERHEYHEHPGSPGPHAHTARSGCKPLVYTNYRGVNVLGAHAHISEMPWILVTEIEEKEAMAPLNKLSRVFILIFLFIPLAAWATGRYVAKRITRPIDRLRRGVERVGRGDLDYKVARGEKDEVGELAEAFNRMTEDLKGSVSSISRLSNEIARRKKVEAALRGSEDRFQEVMKNSREWIWE